MRLLLDTQMLVWMVNGDRRLRPEWIETLSRPSTSLHLSPVMAFEFVELQRRRRIPVDEPLAELIERFDLAEEDFPSGCWGVAADLPLIHRDPVDRMLAAHALIGGFTLATADANLRRYPIGTI